MASFGKNLRERRKRLKLSQDEMASLIGTSKQVISRYERGERDPKVSVVLTIAKVLGVSVDELLTSAGESKPA